MSDTAEDQQISSDQKWTEQDERAEREIRSFLDRFQQLLRDLGNKPKE